MVAGYHLAMIPVRLIGTEPRWETINPSAPIVAMGYEVVSAVLLSAAALLFLIMLRKLSGKSAEGTSPLESFEPD